MLDSKRDDVAPRPGKPGAAHTGGRNPHTQKRKRTQGIDATRRAGGHKQESKGPTEGDRPPVGWARWAAPLRRFPSHGSRGEFLDDRFVKTIALPKEDKPPRERGVTPRGERR